MEFAPAFPFSTCTVQVPVPVPVQVQVPVPVRIRYFGMNFYILYQVLDSTLGPGTGRYAGTAGTAFCTHKIEKNNF